jgi:ribulose-5-phosphate 4-epimerase/fuculose-1-phosphate aldolase
MMNERRQTSRSQAARESATRKELAALHCAFDYFGWTDLTYTHLAARLGDRPDQMLINPYGMLHEVTSSNLVCVDFEGAVMNSSEGRLTEPKYNIAGLATHRAVLRARPEVQFVLHSHTRAGTAVSAMASGVLPISQQACTILGTLAYHRYSVVEGIDDTCENLVRDLAQNFILVLRNHGVLVCGRTVAEAFLYHYLFQSACEIQVDVIRSGDRWFTPAEDAQRALAASGSPRTKPWGESQWCAVLRKLERQYGVSNKSS